MKKSESNDNKIVYLSEVRRRKKQSKFLEQVKKIGSKARLVLVLLALTGGGALALRQYLNADDQHQIMLELGEKVNRIKLQDTTMEVAGKTLRLVKNKNSFELYVVDKDGNQKLIANKLQEGPLRCYKLERTSGHPMMDDATREACRHYIREVLSETSSKPKEK